ncbi:DUF2922 domain-containing protein [Enterococcus sp. HY326]|uniref:DUF2922 domain-containing protein n=1 Tax=Enterococcus sp. HY326 TaxID=2971265 RepID=UPI00223EC3D3|nr:DUF2922 domain-containing protein [Enterococcus sp. HY326]
MRKLHLIFRNADGSRKTLIIHHCHQNLSPALVRWAMSEIIALKLFVRNGVQLYTEIIGAKYVEKRITPLFDDFNPRHAAKQKMRQRLLKKSPEPLSAEKISPSSEAELEPKNGCCEDQLAVKPSQPQAVKFPTKLKANYTQPFFKKQLGLFGEQCCLLLSAGNHKAAPRPKAYLARAP